MARSVTLQTIADRARFLADARYSSFVDDTEVLSIINDVWPELYDTLVSAYGVNYYSTTDTISIAAGTTSYSLPADFYKLIGVDFQVGTDTYVTLKPFPENERNHSLTAGSNIPSGTVRLRYVPTPTVYTALSESIDGIAGWERLVVLAVAIEIMDAEESDSSALVKKYNRTLARITEMSQNRDQSMPGRVSDVYSADLVNSYGALQYRMYGNAIEFISTEYLGSALPY